MPSDEENLQNVSVHYEETFVPQTQDKGLTDPEDNLNQTSTLSEATIPDSIPISNSKLPVLARLDPKEQPQRPISINRTKESVKKQHGQGRSPAIGQGKGSKASPRKRIHRSPLQDANTRKRMAASVKHPKKKNRTSKSDHLASGVPRNEEVSQTALVASI